MKWGNYILNWARPLKSILAVFDNKNLNFKFHHLTASKYHLLIKNLKIKKKIFQIF